MDFEKQTREGDSCRGVIKKLFPSKRYGFAVCECAKHTGEAHFNYSDLDIPESERSCLVVGWRIEFNVIEQHKKTDHCDYRAIQVKPVEVMVVQCEVVDLWDNELAVLTCRELTGKTILVTRSRYNGKFEPEAVTRKDTCRAAVTWDQMKQKRTFAQHCSQDTVSPTPSSTYRPKFKTPEKRTRRSDNSAHNYTDSFLNASAYGEELFPHKKCDQSAMTHHHGLDDSGLQSPDDCTRGQSTAFGGSAFRILNSTSTPKTEKAGQMNEGLRFSVSADNSPHSPNFLRVPKANSMGTPGSACSGQTFNHKFSVNGVRLSSNSLGRSSMSFEDMRHCNPIIRSDDTGGNFGDGDEKPSLLHSSLSPVDTLRDNRPGSTRRNLDREFELSSGNSHAETFRTWNTASPPRNLVYSDSTRNLMSLLTLNERNDIDENPRSAPMEEQGDSGMEAVFGLYDASNGLEHYSERSQPQYRFGSSSWESVVRDFPARRPTE